MSAGDCLLEPRSRWARLVLVNPGWVARASGDTSGRRASDAEFSGSRKWWAVTPGVGHGSVRPQPYLVIHTFAVWIGSCSAQVAGHNGRRDSPDLPAG